jgi:sec-independent protein translocase protein TatA
MFSNIGPWQLLIILFIVLAIFGTKKLRNMGSDLGGAVKGFRSAMNEADEAAEDAEKISDESQDANFDTTPAEEDAREKDA